MLELERIECNLEMTKKSLENLSNSINTFHEMNIYAALGESLFWICVSDDWFRSNSKGYQYRRKVQKMTLIISGIRRAFNAFKHNMILTKFHEVEGGIEFSEEGTEFPFEISEITIHWARIKDNDLKAAEKYKDQIMNYTENLEGNEIFPILKNAYDFLIDELWILKK